MRAASSHLVLVSGVSTGGFNFTTTEKGAADDSFPTPTLAQYASSWLDGLEGLVQISTVEAYAGRLKRHVLPRLGERRLDVILMPAPAQALEQHKTETRFNQPDDYVFTTHTGTPHHAPHIGLGALKPALEKAGLQPVRWHDLRHTYASLLIAGGANITFVSRQLGHTSSQITLGIYAHLLDGEEQARRTREMLQEMLGSQVGGDLTKQAKPIG